MALPAFNDESTSGFCVDSHILQLAAVGAFSLWCVKSVKDIWTEISAYNSKYCITDDLRTSGYFLRKIDNRKYHNKILFIIVVTAEFFISVVVFIVGVQVILTAQGAASTVAGTLAMTFITDIDNALYEITIFSENDFANIENTLYDLSSKKESDHKKGKIFCFHQSKASIIYISFENITVIYICILIGKKSMNIEISLTIIHFSLRWLLLSVPLTFFLSVPWKF